MKISFKFHRLWNKVWDVSVIHASTLKWVSGCTMRCQTFWQYSRCEVTQNECPYQKFILCFAAFRFQQTIKGKSLGGTTSSNQISFKMEQKVSIYSYVYWFYCRVNTFFYETLFIDFSVLYICNANSGQTIFVYLSFLCITLIIRACLIVKFFHSFFFHSFIALFIWWCETQVFD